MRIIEFIKEYFAKLKASNAYKFKKFVLSVPFWIIIVSLFLIIFFSIRLVLLNNRPDRDMAAIWSQGSETSYRHMVVYARGAREGGETTPPMYIDDTISLRKSDVITIRTQLQSIVDAGRQDRKNAGLADDGSPRYWEDCYSTEFTDEVIAVSDDFSPTSSANIVAIGGNYKVFHPFIYLSGGFLADKCVDMNQVVINDVLAWRFFHSYDVVGNKIELLGETFTIAGVVRENRSKIDESSGVNEPRCYIYFSALETYYLTSDSSADSLDSVKSIAITCYEAMLPELVHGVAVADFKNALPTYTDSNPTMYVVSSTDRYNIVQIWKYMIPVGKMSTVLAPYEFPYWERAAQQTILHMFVSYVFVAVGIVLLLIGIIMVILRSKKFSKSISNNS